MIEDLNVIAETMKLHEQNKKIQDIKMYKDFFEISKAQK